MRKAVLLYVMLMAWPAAAVAQTAPQALRNKSMIVSWTENRSLRVAGETAFREMSTPFSLTIYISSAGRPFTRISATPVRRTGSSEAVGSSGSSFAGGIRQVRFSASTVEFTMTMQSGGARRVAVDISGGSCSARVVTAMQVGGEGVIRGRSLVSGQALEIRSVSASGASCALREGNVFGS